MKIIQIGCGKISKTLLQYITDAGHKIVGAFEINKNSVGKDLGEICGACKGLKIDDVQNLEKFLNNKSIDCAVVATRSLLCEIDEVVEACVKNKVNVLTICEEAFYPWNSNPKLASKLDKLAKKFGVTICGTGYQDVSWGSLVFNLFSTMHNVKKIVGTACYNLEDFGPATATMHGAGLNKKQFNNDVKKSNCVSFADSQELIKKGSFMPSFMWNVVGYLAEGLGVKTTFIEQKISMIDCQEPIFSKTLNLNIAKGNAIGMGVKVCAKTKQNVLIECESIGKIYQNDEKDQNCWTIFGDKTASLKIENPSMTEMTCACVVNRIEDVVKAKPGFLPAFKLGEIGKN